MGVDVVLRRLGVVHRLLRGWWLVKGWGFGAKVEEMGKGEMIEGKLKMRRGGGAKESGVSDAACGSCQAAVADA